MLHLLDQTIRAVLDTRWSAPPAKPGFFFVAPDEEWKAQVIGTDLRLNIYLYELRENVDHRRSQWDPVELADHSAVLSRPPAYFDCHYLISAWSPAENGEATTPVLDEHRVLAEALRVLMSSPEVRPVDLAIVGGGPVFQQARICLTVAPPEVSPVLNDFWSTMKLPWRPTIQLIATAPLDLLVESAPAPAVTTFIQLYGPSGATTGFDELITIGGWVLSNADDTPIPAATVQRVTPGGEVLGETSSDAQGRYTFTGLRRGPIRLRAVAAGFAASVHDLTIPDALPDEHIFRLS
jgi:hypothetical protein